MIIKNHSCPPLLKEGLGPFKNWVTSGVPIFLLKQRHNPEKGELMLKWEEGGGVANFFITLQFNYMYCMYVGKVNFPLLHFDSSVF